MKREFRHQSLFDFDRRNSEKDSYTKRICEIDWVDDERVTVRLRWVIRCSTKLSTDKREMKKTPMSTHRGYMNVPSHSDSYISINRLLTLLWWRVLIYISTNLHNINRTRLRVYVRIKRRNEKRKSIIRYTPLPPHSTSIERVQPIDGWFNWKWRKP